MKTGVAALQLGAGRQQQRQVRGVRDLEEHGRAPARRDQDQQQRTGRQPEQQKGCLERERKKSGLRRRRAQLGDGQQRQSYHHERVTDQAQRLTKPQQPKIPTRNASIAGCVGRQLRGVHPSTCARPKHRQHSFQKPHSRA